MNPEQGRQLWAELHDYAAAYSGDQPAAHAWLTAWADRIPLIGCPCVQEWKQLIQRCPPDLSHRATFHAWTVAAHDYINHRLHKPLFSQVSSPQHAIFVRSAPFRASVALAADPQSAIAAFIASVKDLKPPIALGPSGPRSLSKSSV